jgi:hypothetical protein
MAGTAFKRETNFDLKIKFENIVVNRGQRRKLSC